MYARDDIQIPVIVEIPEDITFWGLGAEEIITLK
jgi:hypothetical protein